MATVREGVMVMPAADEGRAGTIVDVPVERSSAAVADAGRIVADAAIAGVLAAIIGVTGGDKVELPGQVPVTIEKLASAHEDWLPAFMAGPAA